MRISFRRQGERVGKVREEEKTAKKDLLGSP